MSRESPISSVPFLISKTQEQVSPSLNTAACSHRQLLAPCRLFSGVSVCPDLVQIKSVYTMVECD